ncbi:MAG: alpha/beta fold hydrolase [Candidatus Latescibacteria bacterium]|nr:alpha/beta fold hydrolase [Candidatus Latescibacterota bacterium]
MQRLVAWTILVLLVGPSTLFAAQIEDLEGSWYGVLTLPNDAELRLVVEFEPRPGGELGASFFSLDEGGQAIRVNTLSLEADVLRLEIDLLNLVMEGPLGPDSNSLELQFQVSNLSLPLDLERVAQVPGFPRSQNLSHPLPYHEEEIAYPGGGPDVQLAATLSLPAGEGPFPAAILITGSGAQDRDETVYYHRPFLILADHLVRRGIAVLRADDRGWGASSGDFAAANTVDFVDDALAGLAYLQSRPEIDPARIGLVGHSEGGMIAPMAAAREQAIAYIALLAGPGIPAVELLERQRRDIGYTEGASTDQIEANIAWTSQAQALLLTEPDNSAAGRQLRALYNDLDQETKDILDWTPQILNQVVAQLTTPWYRYFITYDPAPALEQVQCPVLAINGTLDVQVAHDDNLAGIEAALERGGNPDFTIETLPNLNHFFQTATTGAISEYPSLAETFAPLALERVSNWIRSRTGLEATAVAGLTETLPTTGLFIDNYPNPFNSSTVLRFALPAAGPVEVAIFNAGGQRVSTMAYDRLAAGLHAVAWEGRDQASRPLASGTYLYRLQAGTRVETHKLLLLR